MKRRDMETTVGRPADVCEQDGEVDTTTKMSVRWADALSEMARGPELIDELRDHAMQGRYVLIEPNGALTVGTREYVVRHLGSDA